MRQATLVLAACLGAQSAHALIIDDFTTGISGPLVSVPGGPSIGVINAYAPTGFDTRRVTVGPPTGTPGLAVSSLDIVTAPGLLTFVNDPDVTNSSFELVYSAPSTAGVDLTDSSLNSVFQLDIFFSDVAPPQFGEIALLVRDGSSNVGVASVNFDVAGVYSISFASFSGSLDFTDIVTVDLDVRTNSVDAPDVIVEEFRTAVPEPSTYAALFGAAALGLALLRRRFRR